MEKHIRCLIAACNELGLTHELLDREGNFLRVAVASGWEYFQICRTPFNSSVECGICLDKMHTYLLLSGVVRFPRTLSFLDVSPEDKYRCYREFESPDAILDHCESQLSYPLVIKPNRGYLGINVRLCQDRKEAAEALQKIFAPSKNYDYVALAQEFIPTREEYRLTCAFGSPVLLYRRGSGRPFNARYWEVAGQRASLVQDAQLEQSLMEFVAPVFKSFSIGFVGFDILRGLDDKLYLLELNATPRFDHVIDSNGVACIVEMYRKTLKAYLERGVGRRLPLSSEHPLAKRLRREARFSGASASPAEESSRSAAGQRRSGPRFTAARPPRTAWACRCRCRFRGRCPST